MRNDIQLSRTIIGYKPTEFGQNNAIVIEQEIRYEGVQTHRANILVDDYVALKKEKKTQARNSLIA